MSAKRESTIKALEDDVEHERRPRDEEIYGDTTDAEGRQKNSTQESRIMKEDIAALRMNIDAEKMKDEAEEAGNRKVQEMELVNSASTKTLRRREATLRADDLEKPALGAEVEKLKSHTKAKKQSLDDDNKCRVKEAKAAKDDAEARVQAGKVGEVGVGQVREGTLRKSDGI